MSEFFSKFHFAFPVWCILMLLLRSYWGFFLLYIQTILIVFVSSVISLPCFLVQCMDGDLAWPVNLTDLSLFFIKWYYIILYNLIMLNRSWTIIFIEYDISCLIKEMSRSETCLYMFCFCLTNMVLLWNYSEHIVTFSFYVHVILGQHFYFCTDCGIVIVFIIYSM